VDSANSEFTLLSQISFFFHSRCVHIRSWCEWPAGAFIITEINSTICELNAPFYDISRSLRHRHTTLPTGSKLRCKKHALPIKTKSEHELRRWTKFLPLLLQMNIHFPLEYSSDLLLRHLLHISPATSTKSHGETKRVFNECLITLSVTSNAVIHKSQTSQTFFF